jgi:mannan endo-1,4-beta-mannosidase
VSNFNGYIISGQTDDYYDKIKPITGRSPLLRDFDFQHYTQGYSYLWSNAINGFTFGAEDNGQTQKAIDWYNSTGKKGIVSFQWHWHSPSGGTVGTNTFYTVSTTFDITKAVISGTTENTLILQDIDAIAIQLKRLQAAGVPVLFRPLHEASGGWFWWGAKGPAACLSLFNIVYDRMTNMYGLNNLLWVWSSPEPAWYPGNTKIDIVGHDSYPGNYIYDVKKNDFDLLYTLGNGHKIIAMAENGPIPNPDDCLSLDAPWSYFMSWSNLVTSENTTQHIIDVFSNPKVLTLENVTAVNEVSSDKTVYTLYPNPAKGIVSIKGPEYSSVEVIDLNGKIVYSTSQANNFIQTAGIANGVYIVRIIANNTTFQQKLVVCN